MKIIRSDTPGNEIACIFKHPKTLIRPAGTFSLEKVRRPSSALRADPYPPYGHLLPEKKFPPSVIPNQCPLIRTKHPSKKGLPNQACDLGMLCPNNNLRNRVQEAGRAQAVFQQVREVPLHQRAQFHLRRRGDHPPAHGRVRRALEVAQIL